MCAWLLAAAVAGIVLDVPLRPRSADPCDARRSAPSLLPGAPACAPPAPLPRSQEPPPAPKTKEKLIEFAPWEQVPT